MPLSRLLEFFRNPSRFLLRHRMSIELPRPQELLDDDEPLLPEFGQRAALAERLLPHAIAGLAADELKALARAGVEYPGGALGERQIEAELALLQDYAARVRADTADPALPPHRIEVPLDIDGVAWRVHGDYADLRSAGLVRHRYDDTRAVDYLSGWLHHLLLCAGAPRRRRAGHPLALARRLVPARCRRRSAADPCDACSSLRARAAAAAALLPEVRLGVRDRGHGPGRGAEEVAGDGTSGRTPKAPIRPTSLALRGVADPLDDEFTECARTVFEPLRGLPRGSAAMSESRPSTSLAASCRARR